MLTALARQEPDRVPINFYGNAGIVGRLMSHFGLAPNDHEGLLQALQVDIRDVTPRYSGPPLHEAPPGLHVDPEWGVRTRWVQHDSGGYWDFVDFALKDASVEDVARYPMPSPDDYAYEESVDRCRRFAGYALHIGNAGLVDIINSAGRLRGMEQVLVDLATDDPAGLLLIERMLEVQLEVVRRALEYTRGLVDFVWLGEDLGTQRAPLISTAMFRKHIRPRHQRFIDLAKAYGLPVMVHCCGSSSWAFDDFIEMGISAVDTLQPEAKDMSPAYLKGRFGDRLAFHGCISTAGPVASGSVQDVVEDVRRTLTVMMPGGGYLFAPTHMLQDNSPTENVLAMYEAAYTFGRYR
ncbi:MAG: uroporphyrinogen decarboxylase family protein [Anaerolineae bacterium]